VVLTLVGTRDPLRTRTDGAWDLTSLLCHGYSFSFLWLKRSGRGVDHPSPSIAEVKDRVELNVCCPSGSKWYVMG
jgi:hypothetical protein